MLFFWAIYPVQSDFFFLVIMQNRDGVAIGNGNDLSWPGETGGRYGEEEQEENEAGTAHAGLP